MYKWIIVGGGIQGITMAAFLRKHQKASSDKIAIIDPHARPLENWKRCTNLISMLFLRSPVVHHLDVHPLSLQKFAKNKKLDESAVFYGRFQRPALSTFNGVKEEEGAHCWGEAILLSLNRNNYDLERGFIDEKSTGYCIKWLFGFGKNNIIKSYFAKP